MNILRGICIIMLFSLAGESLRAALPLPIPASIYGLVLLLAALVTGAVKLESVDGAAGLLLKLMPLFFIPPTTGLLGLRDIILPILPKAAVLIALTTIAVMIVSGRVAQTLMRRGAHE